MLYVESDRRLIPHCIHNMFHVFSMHWMLLELIPDSCGTLISDHLTRPYTDDCVTLVLPKSHMTWYDWTLDKIC